MEDEESRYPPERNRETDRVENRGRRTQSNPDEIPISIKHTRRATDLPVMDVIEIRLTRHEKEIKALKEQQNFIINSFPEEDYEVHEEHHGDLSTQIKIRKERKAEANKLKKELKAKIIKTVLHGLFVAIAAIFMLGMQTQFSKWVNAVTETQHSTEEKPSEGKK
jgi:lipopolysaccharide export LptBFGC system permease protein LptF